MDYEEEGWEDVVLEEVDFSFFFFFFLFELIDLIWLELELVWCLVA